MIVMAHCSEEFDSLQTIKSRSVSSSYVPVLEFTICSTSMHHSPQSHSMLCAVVAEIGNGVY